jgi:hypothetical protein
MGLASSVSLLAGLLAYSIERWENVRFRQRKVVVDDGHKDEEASSLSKRLAACF